MNELFQILEQPCDEAVAWVIRQVSAAGLQTLCTFDLQVARLVPRGCSCPRHTTEPCDCQVVVLLVYAEKAQPVSLVFHGHAGTTWLSLVSNPRQRAEPRLEATIRQALGLNNLAASSSPQPPGVT